MSSLVDSLRDSRKSPHVLHHQLILIRSLKPNLLVFFFEGVEDIGVYETWFSRCGFKLQYESVAGKGKEQLINFRNLLVENMPHLLNGVYFFVDHDFDLTENNLDHLYILNAYSIENILCSPESLDSLLRDEFKCTGSPLERESIINAFNAVMIQFRKCSEEINLKLFIARRKKIKPSLKPEKATDFVKISLNSVEVTFKKLDEVIQYDEIAETKEIEALKKEFEQLHELKSQKGKYTLTFFRKWIELLAEDKKQSSPKLFKTTGRLYGEPWTFPIRRLAVSSPIPDGLQSFLDSIASA